MATNEQLSFDLGLDLNPNLTGLQYDVKQLLSDMYDAVRLLAAYADNLAGELHLSTEDIAENTPYLSSGETLRVGEIAAYTMIAGEAITRGNTLELRTDGKVYKFSGGIYNLGYDPLGGPPSHRVQPFFGIANSDGAAGSAVVVQLCGTLSGALATDTTLYNPGTPPPGSIAAGAAGYWSGTDIALQGSYIRQRGQSFFVTLSNKVLMWGV